MHQQWTWPAQVAVLVGTGLFLVFLIPAVVVQYRRFGGISRTRLLGAAAVSVYGVALVAYTLLPLPDGGPGWCDRFGVNGVQRDAFRFLDDIRRETAHLGPRATLLSRSVLQVAFNVLLFVPLGAFLRRYLGWWIPTVVAAGAAVSLAIETTQYTGMWGLYDCAWRIADVDDLLANTLGAFVGAVLGNVALGWIPRSRQLAARRLDPRPPTRGRRLLGMAIDGVAFYTLGYVLVVLYRGTRLLIGHDLAERASTAEVVLGLVVPALVVFVLPAAVGAGASLGQRVLWLAPSWPPVSGPARRPRRGRALTRVLVSSGAYSACEVVAALARPPWATAASAASVGVVALAVLSVLANVRGWSFVVTGAQLVDARDHGVGPTTPTVVPDPPPQGARG